jgi:tetratricopeptide (TPR) repeat protein
MSNKKQPAKKQQDGLLTQADQEQVRQQLTRYKELAHELKKRSRQNQSVEDALAAITELDEASQLALVKALGAEGTIEAADVVQALQNYTRLKTVRKEARRALLRLESADVYPEWQPPALPSLTSILEESLEPEGEAPRFWRGEYSDTEDSGEIQLLLFFEQGERYREVRLLGFLLDFWNDGLKDFFTYIKSKRSTEKQIEQIHMQAAPDVKFLECTLDEARGMIDDALTVNKRNNKPPHPDYVRNRELVDELLESDYEEKDTDESELESALATLPPQLRDLLLSPDLVEMDVSSFLITLENGEYGNVYDSLSNTSPLRQGLSRREWISRHREWRREAMPETIDVHFLRRREETEDDGPLLVDAGWSYAFKDTAEETPPEIPAATLTSAETNRHWFLTTFEMVKERGKYRVHDIIDEGQQVLNLPEEVLRERLTEMEAQAEQIRQQAQKELEEDEIEDEELEDEEEEGEDFEVVDEEDEEDEDWEEEDEDEDFASLTGSLNQINGRLREATKMLVTAMHYRDALIMRTPHDGLLYEQACTWALAIEDRERAATYARLWADHVPEQRAQALEGLGEILMLLASSEIDNEDVYERHVTQAEQAFRESIAIERIPAKEVMLAQALIVQEKQQQEAEDLLKKALQEPMEQRTTTLANASLGLLSSYKGDAEQALSFYQKAAEITPDYPDIWRLIGQTQLALDQTDEAEQSFLRGIQEEPANAQTYNELGQLYLDIRQNAAQAQTVLEQGLEQDPDNPEIIITLARTYIKTGDLDEAEQLLEEAEDIDESSTFLTAVRQELAEARRNRPKPHQHRQRKRK